MSHPESTWERGLAAEERAAVYLKKFGLEILARNLRSRRGELDLVCLDAGTLVIVEVRQRTRADFGGALASVTVRKQRRVVRTAAYCWQQNRAWQRYALRFDVVALQNQQGGKETIEWIKDAFR